MPHHTSEDRVRKGGRGGPAGFSGNPFLNQTPSFSGNPFIIGGSGSGGGGPEGPVGGPPPPSSSPPPSGDGGGDGSDNNQNNQNQNNQNQNNQQNGGDTTTDDRSDLETMVTDLGTAGKKLGTSISDLMGIGPLFMVGKEIGKSFNATNNFYNDLLTKGLGGMDDRDLAVYGDLLGQGIESETLIDFANKNNLDPDQRVQIGEQLRILKNEITGKDYEGIVGAYKAGQPEGFKDSVAGLFGLRDRPEGTLTRGEAIDKIGKAGMAYLDKTNPQLYDELQPYATMQGVEKLASRSLQGLTNSPEDRRYAARIMEARALAADKQSRQDANMAGSSPAFAPPTQPGTQPPTTPPTTPPPGASPTPAPPTGTTPTPFDYSQFPQFDYKMGGLGTTPQFGDFNETLNRFFRFQ